LPIGAIMSMTRAGDVLFALDVAFEQHVLGGVQRRQVLEQDLVLRGLRRLAIDAVDLDQGEVALAFLGRADLAFDGVAGAQVEAAHLARADVDVVGAGQVGTLGRAQEAEAVGQDFQHAVAEDGFALAGFVLQQRVHQVLLAQPVGVFDVVGGRHLQQLADVMGFELG
jgi:hypothetical protein